LLFWTEMIALLEANTWFDLPRVYNKAKLCFLLPPQVEEGLLAFFFFFFFCLFKRNCTKFLEFCHLDLQIMLLYFCRLCSCLFP
jgi:hypothetical protein